MKNNLTDFKKFMHCIGYEGIYPQKDPLSFGKMKMPLSFKELKFFTDSFTTLCRVYELCSELDGEIHMEDRNYMAHLYKEILAGEETIETYNNFMLEKGYSLAVDTEGFLVASKEISPYLLEHIEPRVLKAGFDYYCQHKTGAQNERK